MQKLKLLITHIFMFSYILSSEVYSPRNDSEEKFLQNIRKKQLVVGGKSNYFNGEKIDGESLDSITEEMLTNYLGLNVKFETKSWKIEKEKFKNKEIDILTYLTYTEDFEEYALFSTSILSENLILVSKDKSINAIQDLNRVTINVVEGTIYEKFLKRLIQKNNLDLKYIPVEKIDQNNMDTYVISNLNIVGNNNKLKLGRLPEASIAVLKEYPELLAIINNALEEKYSKKINDWLEKRKENNIQKRISKILTNDEKKYLEKLPPIKVAYRNIEGISRYSSLESSYIGVAPRILNYLSQKLNVKIIEKKDVVLVDWELAKKELLNKNIDILLLSKLPVREKDFIFTEKIVDLKVYEISNFDEGKKMDKKVGVIKNSLEQSVAKYFFSKNMVVQYKNENKMIRDIKNKKISSMLSTNIEKYDLSKYNVDILDIVPVNIALNKENIILRDILDKGLAELIFVDDFRNLSTLEKRKEEILEQKK
ncbi:MAG: transporter substrate-binding domain-containing protein, partial [Fusobacteriaceae bacterium]